MIAERRSYYVVGKVQKDEKFHYENNKIHEQIHVKRPYSL